MSSSDLTALPPGALDAVAARVGTAPTATADPDGISVAFVCGTFNGGISHRMLVAALDWWDAHGGARDRVSVAWAPGAFELPLLARRYATSLTVDAVVALGAVIRGDTGHYDFVAGQCAAGLQRVQIDTGIPVVFGVLTTDTVDQALERSAPDDSNKGREAVITAVEMVRLLRQLPPEA